MSESVIVGCSSPDPRVMKERNSTTTRQGLVNGRKKARLYVAGGDGWRVVMCAVILVEHLYLSNNIIIQRLAEASVAAFFSLSAFLSAVTMGTGPKTEKVWGSDGISLWLQRLVEVPYGIVTWILKMQARRCLPLVIMTYGWYWMDFLFPYWRGPPNTTDITTWTWWNFPGHYTNDVAWARIYWMTSAIMLHFLLTPPLLLILRNASLAADIACLIAGLALDRITWSLCPGPQNTFQPGDCYFNPYVWLGVFLVGLCSGVITVKLHELYSEYTAGNRCAALTNNTKSTSKIIPLFTRTEATDNYPVWKYFCQRTAEQIVVTSIIAVDFFFIYLHGFTPVAPGEEYPARVAGRHILYLPITILLGLCTLTLFQTNPVIRCIDCRFLRHWGPLVFSIFLTHQTCACILGHVWFVPYDMRIFHLGMTVIASTLHYNYCAKPARRFINECIPS